MRFRTQILVAATVALIAMSCSSGADDDSPASTGGETAQAEATKDGTARADTPDTESTEEADAGTTEPEAAESGTSESEAQAAEAASDIRFVYSMPFSFSDLDPSSAFSTEHWLLQNVYETLTRFENPEGSADEQLVGVLAESWSSNDDATMWTFKLREGVTFHDGAPLTAEAVRGALQRTIDLGLGAAFILAPIESMDVEDEFTITFNLAYSAPLDIVMSAGFAVYIMSPDSARQDNAWFNEGNGAGTGPYTLDSYDHAGSTILVQYDDYWGGWQEGQISVAEFRLIEDPVLSEQLVREGEADYTFNLPFEVYDSLDQEPGLKVVRGASMTNLFGLLNHRRLSPEVREALVLSFPYDDVVQALYGGQGSRAHGMIPRTVWGFDPDLALPRTDLERARDILEAAGETDLSLTYSIDADTNEQQQIAEVWRANLATIGVDLVIEPLTFDTRWQKAMADPDGAQDIFTMFWFPTFVTPYDFLFSTFHSEDEPFFNLGYYSNETFDKLIDDADILSGTDREAAIEMFQEAQRILIEEHAGVFILDVPIAEVISTDFSGYAANPAYSQSVWFHDLRATG
jgi:peptide/nickel transport system substrate-binding protein